MSEPSRLKRTTQYHKRFIVRLERYRKRMSVFAAVGKRKARWIGEASRRSMNDCVCGRQDASANG
jgi:hypothetical protein